MLSFSFINFIHSAKGKQPSLPTIMGQSSVFYYSPLSVFALSWISQNFVLIAYNNPKVWRKNFFGVVGPNPPLVSQKFMHTEAIDCFLFYPSTEEKISNFGLIIIRMSISDISEDIIVRPTPKVKLCFYSNYSFDK